MREPETPFEAPWQAQVFAMTVAMNEAGAFTWTRWADAFGAELQNDKASGNAVYYAAWLRAFVRVLVEDGHATSQEVETLTADWHAAARATPHGQPITLAAVGCSQNA